MRSQSRWYVVHTQPRGERRAEHNLRMQSFTVFAPFIARTVRHARQTRTAEAPLFPGYVFVHLDLDCDRWLSINGTAGVLHLIMVRERPLPLPEGLVEALIDARGDRASAQEEGQFHANEAVRVAGEPFAGLIGRIQHVDAKGRVQILLEIMGRSVPARTRASQLRRAAQLS